MYRLFLRIVKGLDPVADVFKRHVEGEGMKLVREVTEAAAAKKEKDAGAGPRVLALQVKCVMSLARKGDISAFVGSARVKLVSILLPSGLTFLWSHIHGLLKPSCFCGRVDVWCEEMVGGCCSWQYLCLLVRSNLRCRA